MEPLNWQHILIEGAVIVVPLLGGQVIAYFKTKWTNTQFPPHRHQEKVGLLYSEGVIYPLKEEKQ